MHGITDSRSFAVIVPYFQRNSGVLRRTLASIAGQDLSAPVRVIVVDDSSPVPPGPEVNSVEWPGHMAVEIVTQSNAGPSAARNRGLDHLGDECCVAFLDSDDCWAPFHLSSAQLAFSLGYDFYTSDRQLDAAGTRAFAKFFADALPLKRLEGPDWAHELTEPLIDLTVSRPIGSTCSMVITRDLLGQTRFLPRLRHAGEDGLFATMLASKRPRVFISTRVDTFIGDGVNIFTAGGWASRAAMMRALNQLQSRIAMADAVREFPIAQQGLAEATRLARTGIWNSFVPVLLAGDLPLRELLFTIRQDPGLLACAFPELSRIAIRKISRR